MVYYKYADFTKELLLDIRSRKDEEYKSITDDMNQIQYAKKYHGFDKLISFWNNWNLERYTLHQYWAASLGLRPKDETFGCLLIKDGDRLPDFADKNGFTYEQKWFHTKEALFDHIKLLKRWTDEFEHLTEAEYNKVLQKENPGKLVYTSTHGADNMILVCPEENCCIIYGILNHKTEYKDYYFNLDKIIKLD